MGWDCTLHVVDDASFARFAARFLHGLHRDAAFDQSYDADEMIAQVKQLIVGDPTTGARALAELALLYVSTETPHVYCRGIALSLWDGARLGGPLPDKWLGSVETRLPDILARYPSIAGRIPHAFDQSYCVGPVVAARDVPALLAHVEQALDALVPGDRVPYWPLRDVLRLAVARNLGYWEGTDIDVAQANADWLLTIRPALVQTVPSPMTSALATPIAIDGTRLLVREHFVFHEIDTSTFPPTVITHADMQVTAAAFTPWHTTFVRVATDPNARPFKFSYCELPDRSPLAVEPPYIVSFARPVRDGVVLFPQPTATPGPPVAPVVLRRGSIEPLVLPERVPAWTGADAIAFGDGSLLIVWDELPYRWDGASPPVAIGEPLGSTDNVCAAVALSDGSIVGGFGGKLVRIDRNGARTTVLALDNVLAVARGPDDVLIIGEGDNPEADALKLWWPATREITQIQRELLGLTDRPWFSYYDAASDLLVVAAPGEWRAMPWSELVAMRRVSEATFAQRRASSGPGPEPEPEPKPEPI